MLSGLVFFFFTVGACYFFVVGILMNRGIKYLALNPDSRGWLARDPQLIA